MYGTREAGGVNAPLVSLRNIVRLALSYAQAAASRNPLVKYAALALARLQHPVCETIAPQQRLQPLGITLHALPDASVDAAAVDLTGNLDRVPPDVPLYFSADGSCSDAAISAGFVFWHPATGVLQRGSCAVATCGAVSEDAEWPAVVLALRQVEGRPNPLVRVGDAAGTSFAGWTRGPPDHSLWALAFRSLVPCLSTIFVDEFWTPAQHRGLTSGPIPSLNALVHEMASGSLRLAAPWTVPTCAGLTDCIVLMHRGALMLQLPAALDAAYKEEVDGRFRQRCGPAVGPWSGTALEQMFLAGSVSGRQALQATRNRLYEWAARPPDFGAALRLFCGLAFADSPRHEARECIPQLMSLLLQTWAAWRVSTATGHVPGPRASLAVYEGTILVSSAHPTFALALLQRPIALPQEVLTRPQWTVYTIGGLTAQAPVSATPLQHHTRVLAAMAAAAPAAPPPFDVVQASLPDTIAGESLVWIATTSVPPAVHILGLSPPLRPWVSIVLSCVLRATRWQAVFLPGPPVVPLAPRSHLDDDGAVVVTCSADLALPHIKLMLTRAASAHGLAVLTSRPAPHSLFLAMCLDVTWHSAMGDLELWVSPGTFVQGLRV